ncbi:Uncharacterized protein Rs2_03146 [Raphanus sativus]|nr:Uncharacterized protein Rs2_03146 [Raphanus sativus]
MVVVRLCFWRRHFPFGVDGRLSLVLWYPTKPVSRMRSLSFSMRLSGGRGGDDEVGCRFTACQRGGPVKHRLVNVSRDDLAERTLYLQYCCWWWVVVGVLTEAGFSDWIQWMTGTSDRKSSPVFSRFWCDVDDA